MRLSNAAIIIAGILVVLVIAFGLYDLLLQEQACQENGGVLVRDALRYFSCIKVK